MCMGAILWSGFSTVSTAPPSRTPPGADRSRRAPTLARAAVAQHLHHRRRAAHRDRSSVRVRARHRAGARRPRPRRRLRRGAWAAAIGGRASACTTTPGSPPVATRRWPPTSSVPRTGWCSSCNPSAGPAAARRFREAPRGVRRGLRVVVRIGWSGAMRDYADPSSNATAYTRVAEQIADVVAQLPLPPPDLLPLLVHAGNELNACNEWRCVEPPASSSTSRRARRSAAHGRHDDAARRACRRAQRQRVARACLHRQLEYGAASAARTTRWVPAAPAPPSSPSCCARRPAVRAGEVAVLAFVLLQLQLLDRPAVEGVPRLTYYRAERAVLNKSLPAVLTETGWARASSNSPVSEADQADWTRRAADRSGATRRCWRSRPSARRSSLGGSGIGGWTFADCPPGAIVRRATARSRRDRCSTVRSL